MPLYSSDGKVYEDELNAMLGIEVPEKKTASEKGPIIPAPSLPFIYDEGEKIPGQGSYGSEPLGPPYKRPDLNPYDVLPDVSPDTMKTPGIHPDAITPFKKERELELFGPTELSAQRRSQNASVGHTDDRTRVLEGPEVSSLGANTESTEERYQFWPERMVRDFATKFSNSKQFLDLYLEGKVAHDDPNLINAITTLASTAGGVGLASAPLRTSSVGTFGGLVGARRVASEIDELMPRLEKALPEEEITKLTGLWKNKEDGKWRLEISDKDAKLVEGQVEHIASFSDKMKPGESPQTILGNVLQHKDLYRIYPELKEYSFQYQKGMTDLVAGFNHDLKTVIVGPRWLKLDNEERISAILHEVQHGLQGIEGFAKGATPSNTPSALAAKQIENSLDNVKDLATLSALYDKLKTLKNKAYLEYLNSPGEREARLVQENYHKAVRKAE